MADAAGLGGVGGDLVVVDGADGHHLHEGVGDETFLGGADFVEGERFFVGAFGADEGENADYLPGIRLPSA